MLKVVQAIYIQIWLELAKMYCDHNILCLLVSFSFYTHSRSIIPNQRIHFSFFFFSFLFWQKRLCCKVMYLLGHVNTVSRWKMTFTCMLDVSNSNPHDILVVCEKPSFLSILDYHLVLFFFIKKNRIYRVYSIKICL